jgi:endonuclease YncB( thermonuclease family)
MCCNFALHLGRSARIGQIQPVREHATSTIGRLCMAGVLAGGLWLSAPERLRPATVGPFGAAADGAGSIAVAGRGHAIDGDTLVIGGVRVRLEGIDAPETGQTCGGRELSSWACGTAALEALAGLVAGQRVSCTGSGYDVYGRLLASCTAAGRELNAEMVRNGLAWAFVRYSQRYAALEAEARSRLIGIWRGSAEPPWSFRARR